MRLQRLTHGGALSLAVWGTAAAIYISIGVFFVEFVLSVFVCAGYLLVVVWLVPAAIRRWL